MRWLCGLIVVASATAVAAPRLELTLTRDRLDATLIGAPKTEPVFLDDVTRHRRIPAGQVQTMRERGEPFAIAILYQADENMLGTSSENEQSRPDFELLQPLADAFDAIDFDAQLPTGSEVLLATYAAGAEIKVPWEPVDKLTGSQLGEAKDYKGKIGADLVAGVKLALAELGKHKAPHKVLLVIGDGSAVNTDTAAAELDAIRKSTTVEIAAIVVKGPVSPDGSVIEKLTDNERRATPVGLEAAIKSAVSATTELFYATFDARLLDEDGKVHELALEARGEELARSKIFLPAMPEPSWLSYLVILGPLMGLGLIIIAILIGRKVLKKAMASEPRRRPFPALPDRNSDPPSRPS